MHSSIASQIAAIDAPLESPVTDHRATAFVLATTIMRRRALAQLQARALAVAAGQSDPLEAMLAKPPE